ncbi:MAG: helix-turn-helix domain-containing protein [Alphaproteobacteria bacterium]|jgi:AcrR family transcriptional regulator|nr:helix-turn-helix domain-containing protein [Alphaproteobacteria bacterium]MDP6567273.1 helix-turn-helix domain-containing protein [Alphaproteobacteria bacterium]MDP6811703.1 helix-turn-helix domain-containing protein [Alphaproteobacteria bacterium]
MAAKKAAKRGGKKKAQPADPNGLAIDAAMRLAAVQGWSDTTMADIADEAGLSLAELRQLFGSKLAILAGLGRMVDEIVLAGSDPGIADEPVRDRLFDVIMRRLDALAPYREGLAAVARDLPRDPPAMACLAAGPLRRSLEWMLVAARVEPWGALEPLQVKGLGLIYLSVLRVWFGDEGEDLAHTMAALDKALGRADALVGALRRGPRGLAGWRRREGDGDEAEAAEA